MKKISKMRLLAVGLSCVMVMGTLTTGTLPVRAEEQLGGGK